MLRNYLKVAWRNLARQKGYAMINVAGLAVGMACFLLIALWVRDELSYDTFHQHADRLYLVTDREQYGDGDVSTFSVNPPELAPTLIREYPEIINATRYRPLGEMIVRCDGNSFGEDGVTFVDPSFFSMFSFSFTKGDPRTALASPNSAVITEQTATKYFGDENPIGKTLDVDGRTDLTVTGVIEDVPGNSHLRFNLAVDFPTIRTFGLETEGWNQFAHKTYVLLAEHIDPHQFTGKMAGTIKRHDDDAIAELSLQPVTEIHLSGDKSRIYIFSLIAAFILLTACINYMNLATARAASRGKEVSLRKVVGAGRKEIALQFLAESLLISLVALGLSLLLVEVFLPVFNDLATKQLSLGLMTNGSVILIILAMAVATGIISGSYPAFFISSLAPASVLKGPQKSGPGGAILRKLLVAVQFVLSIALIIGTIVINRQLHFIQNQELGFDKQHVVCINLKADSARHSELLKGEMGKTEGVTNITAASSPPSGIDMSTLIQEWGEGQVQGEILIGRLFADWDFVSTLGIEMANGRYLDQQFISDTSAGIVVNQAAVRAMGFEAPLGKEVLGRTIVGVVKDFHFSSLRSEIKPLAIEYGPEMFRYLLVRIQSDNMARTLGSLTAIWERLAPNVPFDYQFLDERIDYLYRNDQLMGKIINSFTALALFIACLGLFGIASYTAGQRTKEIGIRKVLGASVPEITFSLVREFSTWVLLSNLIAWPLAYFAMTRVLEGYAYRTSISLWIFLIAGGAAWVFAVATVGYQSVRAALANPITALRNE